MLIIIWMFNVFKDLLVTIYIISSGPRYQQKKKIYILYNPETIICYIGRISLLIVYL